MDLDAWERDRKDIYKLLQDITDQILHIEKLQLSIMRSIRADQIAICELGKDITRLKHY